MKFFGKFLKIVGGVVLTGAVGLGIACAVSEPVRNWTMDRLGIERTVEDDDTTTGDEITNGDVVLDGMPNPDDVTDNQVEDTTTTEE